MIRALTETETAALQAFAAKHGRSWKRKLSEVYWYNARVWNGHHCLHSAPLRAYRLTCST